MTPNAQIDTIHSYIEALNSGSPAGPLSYMHPDIRVLVPSQMPYGGLWTGHEDVERLMRTIEQTWQEWRETPSPCELASADTRVYREVHVQATLAKTGNRIEMYLTELFEFRDDKIAEIRLYWADPALVASASQD